MFSPFQSIARGPQNSHRGADSRRRKMANGASRSKTPFEGLPAMLQRTASHRATDYKYGFLRPPKKKKKSSHPHWKLSHMKGTLCEFHKKELHNNHRAGDAPDHTGFLNKIFGPAKIWSSDRQSWICLSLRRVIKAYHSFRQPSKWSVNDVEISPFTKKVTNWKGFLPKQPLKQVILPFKPKVMKTR